MPIYQVVVYREDNYFKRSFTEDFSEEFTSLEAARKFASQFQYTTIFTKVKVTFFKKGKKFKEEFLRVKDSEDLRDTASKLAIYYLADDRKAELA